MGSLPLLEFVLVNFKTRRTLQKWVRTLQNLTADLITWSVLTSDPKSDKFCHTGPNILELSLKNGRWEKNGHWFWVAGAGKNYNFYVTNESYGFRIFL